MGIVDRIRSVLGGSKGDAPQVDAEAVDKELAVEAVQRDVEAAREAAIERGSDMPGASDGSALR